MKISRVSPLTREVNEMDLDITEEQWDTWCAPNPPFVQDLFPHLNTEEREFILTGYTPEDWEAIFGE